MSAATDTIVAVSSPPGRAARGLIRFSGPATRDILIRLLTSKPGPESPKARGLYGFPADHPRTLTVCSLHLPNTRTPLPILATFFPSPRTYTGQDMAEIQCPGNPALLDRIVHAAMETPSVAGGERVRLAEPGEFTFRAFLAGKLDLTQAEGVAATIAAAGDAELHAASLLRQGKLGSFASTLVDQLANQLALTEAGIDFVDQDDVVPIKPAALAANVMKIAGELDDLLAHSRSWGEIEALPRVVLVGAPSTGKSTLFNALLGRQRAVISPTPGTTRDILAEPLTLPRAGEPGPGVEVMLVDIAGLDTPTAALDEQVQAAARAAIDRADLILLIHDGSRQPPLPLGEGGSPTARRVRGLPDGETVRISDPPPFENPLTPALSQGERGDAPPYIPVRTKSDLPAKNTIGLPVSAITGAGLDDLRRQIAQSIGDRGVSLSAHMLVLQPRHDAALRGAAQHLALARDILLPQLDRRAIDHVELVAGSLRQALDDLACLGGRMTPDDVIGRVFATFCIGK